MSGLNMEVLPSPNSRPTKYGQPKPKLWLRPLPALLDRDSLARWRASHVEGAHERYSQALSVVRAILAADEADRAAVAVEAFAAASARLATIEVKTPKRPAKVD